MTVTSVSLPLAIVFLALAVICSMLSENNRIDDLKWRIRAIFFGIGAGVFGIFGVIVMHIQ